MLTGLTSRPSFRTENTRGRPVYLPSSSFNIRSTSTVSKELVSRLITSIRLGEYLTISSTATLTRSSGWPGTMSTG